MNQLEGGSGLHKTQLNVLVKLGLFLKGLIIAVANSSYAPQVLGQQVKGHKGHKAGGQTQLLMLPCDSNLPSQKWSFDAKGLLEEL